jgi:glyoxylase-like metal-dependent hydrolase (beta-lactamase superfamily II)
MASTGKEHIVINEAPLSYQVYVTPIIATATKDVPPGQSRSTWSPISATLISGRHDAVLVDPLMTIEQGMAVADWVSTTGKNLTTVYVTHGHGDHWLGLGAVRERFPGVRAVATPAVIDGHTDTDDTTVLHVPDIGLVVAGDAAYNDVHQYLAESDSRGRPDWLAALDIVQALSPRAVVDPGALWLSAQSAKA